MNAKRPWRSVVIEYEFEISMLDLHVIHIK